MKRSAVATGKNRLVLAGAATVLALSMLVGLSAPTVSASGSFAGTCPAGKGKPSLPCSASEGQNYRGYEIPDFAEDTEPSVEAVLGYVKGEETDITSVEYGITGGGNEEFHIEYPKIDPGNHSFYWEYSGQAPLAFATVLSDEGGFAIYDVFKKTEGRIDVEPELGSVSDVLHVSFWQQTFTECDAVKVTDTHGKKMFPGCQLAEIVDGRVPCVHVSKEKVKDCAFKTGKKTSGKWLEGVEGGEDKKFALGNQAITRKGKRGGPWVVASKTTRSGELPCRKVTAADRKMARQINRGVRAPRDSASYASDGTLPGAGYTEVPTAAANTSGVPIENYATREIFQNSPIHPDGATQTSNPAPGTFGFKFKGAGMNDMYGMERFSPAGGNVYIDDPYHRHFITYLGATVAAAKRPNTKPDGTPIPNSRIAWRTVAPNANIAN